MVGTTLPPLYQYSFSAAKNWDRIKGLILRHLNAYCGTAAMHESRRNARDELHSILCIAAVTFLRLPQCMSHNEQKKTNELNASKF